MRFRLTFQTYVRHCDDESLVVDLRTGGCTVLRDASPFLERFSYEWRDMAMIVGEIASEFECSPDEIVEDAYRVLDELEVQGFVECEGLRKHREAGLGQCSFDEDGDDCVTPLGDFYARHGLISELHMDLTDGCNESCVHCYLPKNSGTFLPKELAFKILREFRGQEGLTVFFSGGECMLHPEFSVILREARRLGLNIVVMSNLTACDDEIVGLLKDVDPQFVNVSLYAMNPEIHDAITCVPGSWRKTMNAIRRLKDAGVHIRLATPIMRENRNAVEALLQFAEQEHFHDILDCDIFGRVDHDCSNQDHALSHYGIAELLLRYRGRLCRNALPAVKCHPDAKVCDIGEGKLNVNAHGDYYPCDGFHGMVLGNAGRETLVQVWCGEKLNALRMLRNRDFHSCVKCENRPWCKVCPMRNHNETGDMYTPSVKRCMLTAIHRKICEES